MIYEGVFTEFSMDIGGSLAISINASLALRPEAVSIWFDSRVLNCPNDCSCRVCPATTPAINDISVVVNAQMVISYNRLGGRAEHGCSDNLLVESKGVGVRERRKIPWTLLIGGHGGINRSR